MYYVLICEKKIGKKFTCQKFYLLKIPKFGKSGKVCSAEPFKDGAAKKGHKGRAGSTRFGNANGRCIPKYITTSQSS